MPFNSCHPSSFPLLHRFFHVCVSTQVWSLVCLCVHNCASVCLYQCHKNPDKRVGGGGIRPRNPPLLLQVACHLALWTYLALWVELRVENRKYYLFQCATEWLQHFSLLLCIFFPPQIFTIWFLCCFFFVQFFLGGCPHLRRNSTLCSRQILIRLTNIRTHIKVKHTD